MFPTTTLLGLIASLPSALACLAYTGGVPIPTGVTSLSAPITVKAGTTYDGGWRRYERSTPGYCKEQVEGGRQDTVFVVERGGHLKNVIVGANQGEGVYCLGPCTLEFIWFEDVCEDAISIKEDVAGDETWIIGGGAYHGSDKIVQHNGCGKVNIINFYVEDYGKLYRSCGTCGKCARKVHIEGVIAHNGGELAGITKANGDSATLSNVCTDHQPACQNYSGPGVKDGPC